MNYIVTAASLEERICCPFLLIIFFQNHHKIMSMSTQIFISISVQNWFQKSQPGLRFK